MRPEIKKDFSRFLNAAPGRLHMAAHSHHYWPDITFDAHMQAWLDAAAMTDKKWPHIFETVFADVKKGIAAVLNLPDSNTICFAPNTHEFVNRIFSCLPVDRAVKVITTDSEFYSFDRQLRRMEEDGIVTVKRIPTEPPATFTTRFAKAVGEMEDADLVFISHVFFNSGYAVKPLSEIVRAVKDDNTLVVIDGYHGFMATPMDMGPMADRAFYMGGGYKYAMSGEGACFMHCPPGYGARPRNTGWFAEFGTLGKPKTSHIDYGTDGSRFAGATADPTGFYRMRAVFEWLKLRNITVDDLHKHAHALQEAFVEGLTALGLEKLNPSQLAVPVNEQKRGNFLTFRTAQAAEISENLKAQNVLTDYRGDCLRFGFGPYHDAGDIARLLEMIKKHA